MDSNRLLIIDGNSIMNRAFYGIMSSKALMSANGTYTNAIYGFLSILFKELDDLKPEYIAIAFDLKAPTLRHKMYKEYKGTRHAMPEELAQQMPLIKEILRDMNITIIEKEGYEADDVLGTISKSAEKEGHLVTILSGDRDTFQLASDKVTIRIPRTRAGKTETEDYDEEKIKEEYGIEPVELIQVKGLMGDTSDNIPGVPGVGEKTALKLIKEYKNIDNLYEKLEAGEANSIKGALKGKLEDNKELAMMSRTLGTILREAPLDVKIDDLKVKQWNKEAVTNRFKELQFNRFIERFNLSGVETNENKKKIEDLFKIEELDIKDLEKIQKLLESIREKKKFIYYFEKEKIENEEVIIKERFKTLSFYKDNTVYYIKDFELNDEIKDLIKEVFASEEIEKVSYKVKSDYIILKENNIEYNNIKYDAEIAGYNLNPTDKNTIEELSRKYLDIDIDEYVEKECGEEKIKSNQINLFDNLENNNQNENEEKKNKFKNSLICYVIAKLEEKTLKELEEAGAIKLFDEIEMLLVPVLAKMQYNGMKVNENELISFGNELKEELERLTNEIYELCGEEFNIKSPKQLGIVLFEKLKLPVYKKTKTGYTTNEEILEKLRN